MSGYVQIKWHLRYITSDMSETKRSRAKLTTVSIGTRVWPVDCWQICWPSVTCNLRGHGHV